MQNIVRSTTSKSSTINNKKSITTIRGKEKGQKLLYTITLRYILHLEILKRKMEKLRIK